MLNINYLFQQKYYNKLVWLSKLCVLYKIKCEVIIIGSHTGSDTHSYTQNDSNSVYQ